MKVCFPKVVFGVEACHLGAHAVDIVFGDFEGVSTVGDNLLSSYWPWQTCPHLLTSSDDTPILVPVTWMVYSEAFCHADMGGSTDGTSTLHLCLPLHLATTSSTYPPLPIQPWTPVEASIHSVTTAPPALPPRAVVGV